MMNTVERADLQLKNDVLSELRYEPSVQVSDIGVLVEDGTVTLNGYTTSYGEKQAAVRALKRVAGVRAIADDIEIKLPDSISLTDGDIATAAINHIDWSSTIPVGTVTVKVRKGWVTLEGEVEWWYLKDSAEKLVEQLSGVKGVSNLISIRPSLTPAKIEMDIKSAFQRSALLDAKHIQVETSVNKVVLRGQVRNYDELEEAERVAWAAPGAVSVDNRLTVEWFSF
jgi:osmotically-inducible protein OsmY